jgi:dTDP-4-amino-4,6-dideoxygalactose transaminase
VKLKHLQSWTEARRHRAERYRQLIADMALNGYVQVPQGPQHSRHVYNQFSIRCQDRDALRDSLRNSGIPSEIYYPLPLHLQPAFSYLEYREGQFPMSEAASREVLSLPVYPELKDSQQMAVVRAIADFFAAKS